MSTPKELRELAVHVARLGEEAQGAASEVAMMTTALQAILLNLAAETCERLDRITDLLNKTEATP